MAVQTLKMTIQFRRDTTANWELHKDVVPAAGEPCFDTELGTLKIGDGIKTYGQLAAIGGNGSVAVSADGKSIVLADGVFKLAGFDAAEIGAQPRKKDDGTLEWVVPSVDVEGLKTTVEGLQTDVAEIQDILMPSGDGQQPLLARVQALEGNIDALNGDANTDGSVLKIVKDEINAFATNVSDDKVVNTFKELVDYVANHGGEAATMAADIADLQSAVEGKVDAEVGKSLVSDTLIAKLEAIEEVAQVNKIEAVKVGDTLLEIVDKSVNIPVATADTLGVVKGSDEVTVGVDGALSIGHVSVSKLVQEADTELVLDGGAAG